MADLEPVSAPDAYATEPKSKILVLIIVSRDDRPLLIQDLSTPGWRPDPPHLASFVAHQALDVIDELVWTNPSMYLKEVDVFDCLAVWAFVSTSHVRFLLVTRAATWTLPASAAGQSTPLPPPPSCDSVRAFLKEVHELYCKYLYNPLYPPNGLIVSREFNLRVQRIAKKHLI
ncbi:sedlin, N-terminal conserved region family protein, putative [Babesia bigemina]|uniref:Sedlin, N-terminal conserved region family protein, putative n=2 Tax=Babesia bigemina TaxID=5866 RepID=A0A061DCS3_BABBI|nr:sedlin, N-terminal conserved region family protein, putative [Babesia bigemina]CDR96854.1 sedlin, N-terminal conserved region family protein, putative [Babesia bigemina]|eukprot:XP_012769040.1 sedlin, N-terminal conserved region family protein, putative [Babesia bigemina]